MTENNTAMAEALAGLRGSRAQGRSVALTRMRGSGRLSGRRELKVRPLAEALEEDSPRHLFIGSDFAGMFGLEDVMPKVMRRLNRRDTKFYDVNKTEPSPDPFEKELSERSASVLRLFKGELCGAVMGTWKYTERHERVLKFITQFDQVFTFSFPAMCAALSARLTAVYMPERFQEYHLEDVFYGRCFTGPDDPRRVGFMEYGTSPRIALIRDLLLPAIPDMPIFENFYPCRVMNDTSIIYNCASGARRDEIMLDYPCGIVFGVGVAPKFDRKPTRIIRCQHSCAQPLERIEGELYVSTQNLCELEPADTRVALIRHNKAISKIIVLMHENGAQMQADALMPIYKRAVGLFGDHTVELCVNHQQDDPREIRHERDSEDDEHETNGQEPPLDLGACEEVGEQAVTASSSFR